MPERVPIVVGDAFLPVSFNDCGCCDGVDQETPLALFNRPDLPAIRYRVGTHAQFMESMLARLSSPDFPASADLPLAELRTRALTELRTRDSDDFTIALLDGWATIADILTFYQERIANESYLGTATEGRSLIELAKLLGYRPRPGVAANTTLAFFLAEAVGAPEQAIQQTTIPRGTRVQSVPGPEETPQTFETVDDFEARLEWNALRPRTTQPQVLTKHSQEAFLKGTDTGLKKGDAILFVGEEREADDLSEAWDLRYVKAVEPDHANGRTRIDWVDTSELRSVTNDGPNPSVHTLRLRASLFGHNAIDPKLLHRDIWRQFDIRPGTFVGPPDEVVDELIHNVEGNLPVSVLFASPFDWNFQISGATIFLDSDSPELLPGSWMVLSRPRAQDATGPPVSPIRRLFKAASISSTTLLEYGLNSKAIEVVLEDGPTLQFPLFAGPHYRKTTVLAQSERLDFAEAPLLSSVMGSEIVIDRLIPNFVPGQRLLVRGRTVPLFSIFPIFPVIFASLPGNPASSPSVGTPFTTFAAPGVPGNPVSPVSVAGDLAPALPPGGGGGTGDDDGPAAPTSGQMQTELVRIKRVEGEGKLTKLVLEQSLKHVYERSSLEIFANITAANHGETVNEILGSGDASQLHQRFVLKQKPLTYISATNPSGAASTLEVRVNNIRWAEVPTLLGRGSRDRVYSTEIDDEGKASVRFGDGINGLRVPTGQNNVRATYRKGIGLAGQVAAGQISLLMSRPLGVQSVVNPVPATGAADPESSDETRPNAPSTVLTLDRAVSLQDYEDFARSFSGVAKALATWSWDGFRRRVCLSVAGPEGAMIVEGGTVHADLVNALKSAGDPFVDFVIKSFRPVSFRTALTVKIDDDYLPELILTTVEETLRLAFGFAARSLGQPVHLSEVIATVEAVEGVKAVDVDHLRLTKPPKGTKLTKAIFKVPARLPAQRPVVGPQGTFEGAELLTLDAGPIALGVTA